MLHMKKEEVTLSNVFPVRPPPNFCNYPQQAWEIVIL